MLANMPIEREELMKSKANYGQRPNTVGDTEGGNRIMQTGLVGRRIIGSHQPSD